ncbi:hypothetical protein [Halobacterium sp. KA-6]|uniref:hypothetical protein n=1 Tax=Halobacterium sp. KA-6 TaxID=2896368 RepID=UPI001E3E8E62|nr:hypothetical protein [Halobacterium sp. KA-6]MCD2202518.1 hypothetical protein [Halobacterium sp. KA-6]
MNRRTLLRRTAAASVALPLAGCLRSGDDEAGLTVAESTYEEGENGNVVVVVTVSNPSGREASGTLYVNTEFDDEAYTRVREVTLGPNETTVVRVEYDVAYDDVTNASWNTDLVED